MPFTLDNPPKNIKNLPASAQKLWIDTFNKDLENPDTGDGVDDDASAAMAAWGAVKKVYKKDDDTGKWVKKAGEACKLLDRINNLKD